MIVIYSKTTPPVFAIFVWVARLCEGVNNSLLSVPPLKSTISCPYNRCNTAATPLNNAQPWRLFYACGLCKYTGGYYA